ncbi:phage tail tape measure protein [Levilactobacillus lanxiensis]|uniref:Phage tail tape measure protein n=1 Tax=Levilactobacillus lanxiensis TaxID=2799568 RepID=A0ABW4D3N2_9LACO|nr:phage tail tape measure protein [Levilactobacillus lanxiensis]
MPDIAGDRISYRIDINGLSQLDGMKRTIEQMEKLVPGLNKSVKNTQQSIKKMNDEASHSRVTDSLNQEKRGFDGLTSSVGRTGSKIDWANMKTTNLTRSMKKAGGTSYFKKQSRDLDALGNKMQSFGRKATVATAAIAAGAGFALKTATDLQNRYKTITNLAETGGEKQSEATKNVAKMQRDATKYSDTYGVSQKKIAEGYETLNRRGYTTNQALGSQKSYLQGAIASGDAYSDVVSNAASAIEQFGMKVNSVKGMASASKTAINQMAYSADLTATSFGNLGEALKFSGPDAHAAHQSLHTTVAAIGDISNFGIDGSQAGTSMRQIYQRLTSPPSKGKAPNAMKDLGLKYSDFRDSKNELLPIQDIFEKLATRMNKMKKSQTDKGAIYAALFGVNASSAAQALGNSYKQVDALDKKVQKSQNMYGGKGYVSQLSEKNLDTLKSQWNRIKSGLLNDSIDVFNAWMPTLTKLAKQVADLLEGFQKLPAPTKKFIGLGVGLTALVGPVALLAGSLLKMHGALSAIIKLGGKSSGGKTGIIGQMTGFLGIGKNNPRKFSQRSGATHFSSQSRVPGSLIANGVDWNGLNKRRKSANTLTRNVVSKVKPGRALLSGMDTLKSGRSWLWNETKSGTSNVLGKAKGGLNFLKNSKIGTVAKIGGKLSSRVPVLDVAMAGTNLIGMNQKNAGKKVGSAGGMLAGGAIGSMFGPIGGVAGAAIGQTMGTEIGSTIQKSLPKKMKKSIGSAVKDVKKTFSSLAKPFKATVKSISKVWGSATKGISKAWSQYVIKPLSGKNGSAAIKGTLKIFKSVLVPTMKIAGVAFKVFGAAVKTAIKVAGHIIEGFIKTVSGVFALISDLIHGRWKNIWKDAVQIFTGIFGTIGNVLGDILKTVWDGIVDLGKNIGKFLAHPVKTIESWVGGGGSSATPSVKAPDVAKSAQSSNKQLGALSSGKSAKKSSKPKINIQTGLAHAAGGFMRSNHLALVGEGGPEMAYHAGKGYMRWLGMNGPTLTKVRSGERILNARDSASVAKGGLGRGMMLPGYASGTAKLVQGKNRLGSASLNFDAYGASTKKSTKSLSKLQKGSKRQWSTIQRNTSQSTGRISKKTSKDFTSIQKDTGKTTDSLRKNTVADFDTMQKGSMAQMNQLHKGMNAVAKAMVNDFDDIFSKLSTYAHKEMAAAIKQLNGGVKGINTVLNKFGGGGSVLPMIHYAQGSQGPISKHTMAVVNDAKVGPRQEAILKSNGHAYLPKGNDVVLPLGPGDEVLNGSETAQLQDVGALPHFAKGTGALKRLIKSSDKHPKMAWNRDFSSNVKGGLDTALGNGLFGTGKRAATHVGVPWNAEVWSQLKSAMSSDSGGGSVLHSPGPGWRISSGFGYRGKTSGGMSNHDGTDFSQAKVVHALEDATVTEAGPGRWLGSDGVGEVIGTKGGRLRLIYQELNGKYPSGATLLVHAGDHVKQGQAIAKLGPSGTHVHIGATTKGLWDHGGSSTKGWLDVTKLHGSFGNPATQKKSKNPALTKLVKSELGKRLKWVSNKLGEDSIGSIGSLGLSGGLASRARTLAAAFKKLYPAATNSGIAAVLGNWNFESGGLNPGAVNSSGGASGLGQWLGVRKTALMNFARRKGKSWKNAGLQLEFALKGDGSDSSLLKSVIRGKGSVASLAARFSNGWERGGYTSEHVAGARQVQAALHANGGWAKNGKLNIFGEAKGENEVAVNTKRPSADPLLLEAMSDRAIKAPNSVFGQFRSFAKMQHEFAKMKDSQAKFAKTAKAATPTKSNGLVVRPQITYSPKFVINGSTDPKEAQKLVAKQAAKDRRQFESMMNDLCDRLMSVE